MYKALIVDDERNIRLGIQAMIKREYPSFETFTAANGMEALEIIRKEEPQILITDIKMPDLDGIQLIKELETLSRKPAVIILSGYDDFSYAKEAIKHKVKDYLLKPVNRMELYKTLNSVTAELESDHKWTQPHMDDYRASQLNYILLNPNLQKEDLAKLYQKLQIDSYRDGYYVGILATNGGFEGEGLLRKINQLLSLGNFESSITFLDKDERVVVITADVDAYAHLKDQLGKERYVGFSIGVSEKAEDMKELRRIYQQAEDALKYHFIFPRRQIIRYGNVKDKPKDFSLPLDLINKVSNMLGTDREREIRSYLLKIMDFEMIAHNDISYIEKLNQEINETIFQVFFSRLGEESLETFKLINKIGNIYHFSNFHEYFHALEDLLMRIHEYNKRVKSVYSEQKYMDKAIMYIRENYHKDLNLAVVSNYISLNYSYFSHMFKEYTGQNFVDYLKMVRIEGARQLLKETDYKVFEISEMVGYKNPKQFARVFREIEGISPREYRDKNDGMSK